MGCALGLCFRVVWDLLYGVCCIKGCVSGGELDMVVFEGCAALKGLCGRGGVAGAVLQGRCRVLGAVRRGGGAVCAVSYESCCRVAC